MNTSIRLALPLLAVALAGSLGAANVQAMPHPRPATDYGALVMNGATRTVVIDANTRYVNVTNGETVRFDVDGMPFTFSFDAWRTADSVDLSTIAPAGANVPKVRVYIAPSTLYVG